MVCSVASIRLSQFRHRALEFGSDHRDIDLVRIARRIIARLSDDEPNSSWSRQSPTFRPGVKSTIQIARQNSYVAPGHKRADSGFEFLDLARLRSSAFRKDNQNVSRIRQKFGTNGKALTNVRLSRERQRVDHDRRDPD